MKIKELKSDITDKEKIDIAYWERNVLALLIATIENNICIASGSEITCGWYYDLDNNWDGWKRVISLFNGTITYHIKDDFEVGKLPQIEPNWDGHTTIEKYEDILEFCEVHLENKDV